MTADLDKATFTILDTSRRVSLREDPILARGRLGATHRGPSELSVWQRQSTDVLGGRVSERGDGWQCTWPSGSLQGRPTEPRASPAWTWRVARTT